MRSLVYALSALAAAVGGLGSSAADPLWQAEVRAGYGIAVGGGGAQMSARPSPLTLAGTVAFAFNEDPPLAGYGGLAVETLDRNAVGSVFGVQLWPHDSHLRLAAGGIYLFAPYTLWGATASIGLCFQLTLQTRPCHEWEAVFNKIGVPAGCVLTVPQALALPQVRERELLKHFGAVPGIGRPLTVTRAGFKLTGGEPDVASPPPQLGAHTREVLESVGYDAAEIERLRAKGVL